MNVVIRNLALILALATGLWLRWDGLGWGRTTGSQFHPDEPRFVEQADALDRGLPLRKSYVFGFGQALRAVRCVCPSPGYADIARALSLASGMLLCLVVFALARELKLGTNAAALAAALAGLNTMCVIHSHYGTADMTYVLFLHLFALAALRGWLPVAAVVTGLAMATKFGMILVPSLLWLVCSPAFGRNPDRLKAGLQVLLLLLLAGFIFFAAQGFTFDRESVRMISLSVKKDNVGGFEHQKWQNIITYAGVAVRALGIPVLLFAVIGLVRARRATRFRNVPAAVWIALLPFALHALGLLAINTAFPRHLLPLVPLLLLAAARGVEGLPRLRLAAATLCLGWSALLAWSDGRVFADDPREAAMRAVERMRAEPAGGMPGAWKVATRSENVTWRFERSEVNPLRPPNERELYHASPAEFRRHRDFQAAVAEGAWKQVFEAGPLHLLPEQFLYDAAWGSFEKFAGKCAVYVRAVPQVPSPGTPAP